MTEEKAGHKDHDASGAPTSEALNDHSSSSVASSRSEEKSTKSPARWQNILSVVTWTPPWCRWDPEKPPQFSMGLNVLFGFAGAFTVANLYYNHPILNILAHDFGVPYEKVAQIPTVMQAGYATGLLFLCPLGDTFRRRPFIISLVWLSATLWIGLCVTTSLPAFTAISYLAAIGTVTPQLMLPLVADLAPPNRRASALGIVVSGLIGGIVVARLLSGVVTNFTSWRVIYWIAFALQYTIVFLLWLFMPDYPATNKEGINYFKMLWSIACLLPKHPVLVYACLIGFCTSATFTSFWTTLTFLLAGAPYYYSPLVIGLFALIGLAAMVITPFYSRLVIDRFVPLFSTIMGELMCIIGIILGTYTGTFTVAGPILQAFLLDLGMQTSQIANRTAFFSIAPKARNRVNTAYMVFTFSGQLTGTSVGSQLYARGGWIASGSLSVGFIGLALILCFLRGPWEKGWYGWTGGWSITKKPAATAGVSEANLGKPTSDEEKGNMEETSAEKGLTELAGEDGENPLRRIRDEEEEGRNPVTHQERRNLEEVNGISAAKASFSQSETIAREVG